MRIHKEGYTTLLVIFLAIIATLTAIWLSIPFKWFNGILSFIFLLFYLFIIRFFRDPERKPNKRDDEIISPADGLVVSVTDHYESEYYKDKRKKIAIFMSGHDVHINWTPIAGNISYHVYYPGKHLFARNHKSSELNERTNIVISDDKKRTLLMRQIAGVMARRVVSRLKTGQQVEQCEEFGFIKLGSRVELFLPTNAEILVKPGQKVVGRQTPLAKWAD